MNVFIDLDYEKINKLLKLSLKAKYLKPKNGGY